MPKLGDELPTPPDTTAARPMPDRSDLEEERVPKKKKRNIAAPEEYAVRLKDRMTMLTLRDWSHVMGMAAIKGWGQEPLQKVAKEYVELFDRDMKLRTLDIGTGNTGRTGIVQRRGCGKIRAVLRMRVIIWSRSRLAGVGRREGHKR